MAMERVNHDARWMFWTANIPDVVCNLLIASAVAGMIIAIARTTVQGVLQDAEGAPVFICGTWDQAATDAGAWLQNNRNDGIAQRAENAMRLQHARKACGAGNIAMACQDYRAIVQSVSDGVGISAIACGLPQ